MDGKNKFNRTQMFLPSVDNNFSVDNTITEFGKPEIIRMMGSQGGGSTDSTRQLIILEVGFLKSIAESKHKLV